MKKKEYDISSSVGLAFQYSLFKFALMQRFHQVPDKNGRFAHVRIVQLTLRDDLALKILLDLQSLGMGWPGLAKQMHSEARPTRTPSHTYT